MPFAVSGVGIPQDECRDQLLSRVDLPASFGRAPDVNYDQKSALDSQDHSALLLGKQGTGPSGLGQEAIQNALSYVSEDGFKYIPPSDGSGSVPWGTEIETGF